MTKFPTRDGFSDAVLEAFRQTPAQVEQWVCAKEPHEDGGDHYHMAIKLDRVQRWLRVKNYLERHNGVVVNFSSRHSNYYTAWQYVTKDDADYVMSMGHPQVENAPRTMAASQALSQSQNEGGKRKRSRLSAFEAGEIAVANNLKTRLQLLAFANMQKREGNSELAEFILNRGKKVVEETLATAWEMATAEEALERSELVRIDILTRARDSECICHGQWLRQAVDILQRNAIERADFANSVYRLLSEGRGKYLNLIITGPTNCGKTFILQPLTVVFKTFCNPATTTYAWIGAAEAEIILLNDFRWCPQVI